MKKTKNLLNLKLNAYHFILSLGFMFLLSFIFTWLCNVKLSYDFSIFSGYVLIAVLAIDFVTLLFVLVRFCKLTMQRGKMGYCKLYLITGIMLFILYIVTMVYELIIK